MEIILILIVVVSVIALFNISKKRKELEGDVVIKKDLGGDPHGGLDGSGKIIDDKPVPPPPASVQNTIYECTSGTNSCVCPFCDGEHPVGTKICSICGRDI